MLSILSQVDERVDYPTLILRPAGKPQVCLDAVKQVKKLTGLN